MEASADFYRLTQPKIGCSGVHIPFHVFSVVSDLPVVYMCSQGLVHILQVNFEGKRQADLPRAFSTFISVRLNRSK